MSRTAPCDWDHESLCIEDGCTSPATHRRLLGMVDDVPSFEMVCCQHAEASAAESRGV